MIKLFGMVSISNIITFLFSLLLCVSCRQSENGLSEKSAGQVRDEVLTTLRQYHKDIRYEGMLAELKYLDSTDLFSWYAPGYTGPIGYDSVAGILAEMAPLYSSVSHRWDSLTVNPESRTEASYSGTVTSSMTQQTGYTDTIRFREEGTMIKRKDGWKLVTGKTVVIE